MPLSSSFSKKGVDAKKGRRSKSFFYYASSFSRCRRAFRRRFITSFVADTKKKTPLSRAVSIPKRGSGGIRSVFSNRTTKRALDDDASVVIQQKRSSKSQRAALVVPHLSSTNGRKDVLFFDAFSRERYTKRETTRDERRHVLFELVSKVFLIMYQMVSNEKKKTHTLSGTIY